MSILAFNFEVFLDKKQWRSYKNLYFSFPSKGAVGWPTINAGSKRSFKPVQCACTGRLRRHTGPCGWNNCTVIYLDLRRRPVEIIKLVFSPVQANRGVWSWWRFALSDSSDCACEFFLDLAMASQWFKIEEFIKINKNNPCLWKIKCNYIIIILNK